MNVFDGRALADQVLAEAGEIIGARKLSLGVIVLGEDPVSANFIAQKEKRGAEIGIAVRTYRYPIDTSTRKLREQVADLVKKTKHDGFIVQLPLPEGINTQYALNAVPEDYDVDCLNQKSIGAFVVGRSKIMPPVVGAVKTLLENARVELSGKKIVLVGAGRLVGRPAALWLIAQDLPFTVLTYQSLDLSVIREADIVVSGTGQPGLIKGAMLKNGAIVIDAGTSVVSPSIDSGRPALLVGDVDAGSCKDNNGWLAPVPGGVGPLTVAHLFKNLATLAHNG